LEFFRNDNKHAGNIVMAVCSTGLLQLIQEALEPEGLQTLSVEHPADAPARAKSRQPSLLLVDETASNTVIENGMTLPETLKSSSYTSTLPVVVLLPSGAGEEAQLEAFRRGANDCFERPESGLLLRARLKAVAQRYCPPTETADKLSSDDLVLDLRARKVTVGGRNVALTRKEFDLLNMLMRKRGIVVYTTHLYHSVWGYGDSSPIDAHTVKVHISSLRGKLGDGMGRKIVNLPGLGYRFDG
jgi:DNA-binding response OmpR family regulator